MSENDWVGEWDRKTGENRRGGLEREGGGGKTDEEQAEVKAERKRESWKLRIMEKGKGEKPKKKHAGKGVLNQQEKSIYTDIVWLLTNLKNVLE